MNAVADLESFASLFEESLSRKEMRAGELITAQVVRVEQNVVVVNAGLKSESFIPVEEFKDAAVAAWDDRGRKTGMSEKAWLASEVIKLAWRAKNNRIAAYWKEVEDAAIKAVREDGAGRIRHHRAEPDSKDPRGHRREERRIRQPYRTAQQKDQPVPLQH